MKDVIYLKTGFKELDELINGINKRNLVTIASRPALGKSTLAIDIINNVSKQTNSKILYFNLESPKETLRLRVISPNVEIVDDINSIENIKERCEEFKSSLSLLVIDYFQLITTSNKYENRYEEKDYITRILKTMTIDYNIPIIVIYQLSRSSIERDNKRTSLFDILPEGALMQDTDKLIYLYSDDYYKNKLLNEVELIVAKRRDGNLGTVRLKFNKSTLSFEQ